jgi:hypothetical protein
MPVGPLIAGRRYSYSSIEIMAMVGPRPLGVFIDVDDISYSESLEFAFRRGTSRVPIGSTAGMYNPQEGSMQMGKSTFQSMITQIGPGWMGINITLNVAYFDVGETLTLDTILCRLTGVEDAHAYGPEALVSVVKFMPLVPILRNGVSSMLPLDRVI